ncbi:MAG: hypothetical protein L0Y72_16745 [Gemmataceae bacterium]|nr:hypothetical protein [Gemmataceae bacterium]MCI0740699.1 hypothetical protein [Gemmataceae bacterium]
MGRKIDIFAFIDELLDIAKECREIRCRLETDQSLHFELGDQACAIDVDAARGKLRMLCARLSALCHDANGDAVMPYGGLGTIKSAGMTVRFKNTPDEHEFSIKPVAARPPTSNEHAAKATIK